MTLFVIVDYKYLRKHWQQKAFFERYFRKYMVMPDQLKGSGLFL